MSSTGIKDVTNIIEDNMMRYSHAVLTDRAIPTIQDGMKPVARRIMFTLQNKNITKLTKSMNVTGLISAVHPHGTTYITVSSKDKAIELVNTGKFYDYRYYKDYYIVLRYNKPRW